MRRRWIVAGLALLFAAWLVGAWWATRPAPVQLQLSSGGFTFTALPLPEGVHPRGDVQCVEPGYVQLWTSDDTTSGALCSLRTFEAGPAGLTPGPAYEYAPSQPYGLPVLAWPDGQAVMSDIPERAGGSLSLPFNLMKLRQQAIPDLPHLAQYTFKTQVVPVPKQLGNHDAELLLLIHASSQSMTDYCLLSCPADGAASELERVSGVTACGTAWHARGILPAVVTSQGEVRIYDPQLRRLTTRPELRHVGAAIRGNVPFAIARDFAVVQTGDGWEVLGQAGAIARLTRQEPISEGPDGRPRGLLHQLRAHQFTQARPHLSPTQYQQALTAEYERSRALWAKEGHLVAADRASADSDLTLVDAETVALIDSSYSRVVLIQPAGP